MSPLDCDACYTCLGCGLLTCADERPSPGEPHACSDCHNLDNTTPEVTC